MVHGVEDNRLRRELRRLLHDLQTSERVTDTYWIGPAETVVDRLWGIYAEAWGDDDLRLDQA